MAFTAVSGKKFILLIDDVAINCEIDSSISITAEPIEVRCKGVGSFPTYLEDVQKSGDISFSGVYSKVDVEGSGFALQEKVGSVYPFAWGGTEAGDEVVTGNFFLATVELTSADGESVQFSGSGNVSGDPVYGTVSS